MNAFYQLLRDLAVETVDRGKKHVLLSALSEMGLKTVADTMPDEVLQSRLYWLLKAKLSPANPNCKISVTFPPMTTNIQSDIAAARAKLDAVSAELRALEERAKQEAAKPWEPKGGHFYLPGSGAVREVIRSDSKFRLDGSEYPTREAAESALPYVTFFKRLCCLAQELNPSGKVGGVWWLLNLGGVWKVSRTSDSQRDPLCLFETEAAADQAAHILNRDKWTVPSL